jgi:hypothetical protein
MQKKNINKKLVFDKSVRKELKWKLNRINKLLKFNKFIPDFTVIVRNVEK